MKTKKVLSLVLASAMCVMSTGAFAAPSPKIEDVPIVEAEFLPELEPVLMSVDILEEIEAIENAIAETGDVIEFFKSEGIDVEKYVREGGGTTIANEIKGTPDSIGGYTKNVNGTETVKPQRSVPEMAGPPVIKTELVQPQKIEPELTEPKVSETNTAEKTEEIKSNLHGEYSEKDGAYYFNEKVGKSGFSVDELVPVRVLPTAIGTVTTKLRTPMKYDNSKIVVTLITIITEEGRNWHIIPNERVDGIPVLYIPADVVEQMKQGVCAICTISK